MKRKDAWKYVWVVATLGDGHIRSIHAVEEEAVDQAADWMKEDRGCSLCVQRWALGFKYGVEEGK